MESLLKVLGRSGVGDELAQKLADRQSCWLSGPSGTGKTELSRYVANMWLRTKGEVRWIVGDKDQAATTYLAANRTLAATRARRTSRDADKDFPLAVLRGIPWVGTPISALAKMLVTRLEPSGPDFLSAEAQDLLAGFQKECISERILFIVDNVHWLDSGTADLLVRMVSPEVSSSYTFIERSVFLFVETTDQDPVESSAARVAELKARAGTKIALQFSSRSQFPDVLLNLGLDQQPDKDVCDRLYDLTRGHLKLAKEIVRLLQQDVPEKVLEQDADPADIAEKLLTLRLASLPANATDIQKLLGIASCIGQTFSKSELECAFSDTQKFASALDIARREEFVSGEGDVLQFSHEVVQTALKMLVVAEAAPFHHKLAECVRHIRPGDYRSRLRHSTKTEDYRRSASVAFALLMQERRGETQLEAGLDRPSETALGEYRETFNAANAALAAMDNGRHAGAIQLLFPFYDGEDTLVQGEIAYLLALNYYKQRSRNDYENARAILEPWIPRRDEGELWYRLMLTLAVVHASLGDQRSSSETLTRVRIYLEKSVSHDAGARAKIQILNRKADVFYPLEVAAVLIEKAIEYFAPPPGSEIPRNAFQYTAALINYSGNAYIRGEFASSLKTVDLAVRFISAFSNRVRLPEAYKAFNNYAIAAVRAEHLAPLEALEILDTVAHATGGSDRLDFALLSANRGVANFLAGPVEDADALLKRSYDGCKKDEVEGYYLAFAASNYAASRYLLGAPKLALDLLEEVDQCLWENPGELRRSLSLRQQCMKQAIAENLATDPKSWDNLPKLLHGSDGPNVSWRALGYGVIMSDIQVWSES